MRTLFTILALCYTSLFTLKSQELPSEPQEAFAFPLGCKATIKLIPVDSVNFHYSVLKIEPLTDFINMPNYAHSLPDSILENNTISFVFGVGVSEKEKEENNKYKTLLILKNTYQHAVTYKADIQVYNQKEFEPTSVVPLYPKVLSTELWPYRIDNIALYGFRKIDAIKD